MPSSSLKRENHYVAQSYLRQWSSNGDELFAYRTLVSSAKVHAWQRKPIRGIARQRDFYLVYRHGGETDEFERWLESEIETPAASVLKKVLADESISTLEMFYLARYFAAQDLRTPKRYVEHMQFSAPVLQEMIDSTLESVKKSLSECGVSERESSPNDRLKASDAFKVTKSATCDENGDHTLQFHVLNGRKLWIDSDWDLLQRNMQGLAAHHWSIVEPDSSTEWYTSDCPTIKLNYYGEDRFDFRGGWQSPGTELILPLSPRHLLFTRVGEIMPERFTLNPELTYQLQKFISLNAYRWIYARTPLDRVLKMRARLVNAKQFKEEQAFWREWGSAQTAAEKEFEAS